MTIQFQPTVVAKPSNMKLCDVALLCDETEDIEPAPT